MELKHGCQLTQVQRILYSLIQCILKAPMTTPSEIITAEIGIWDIETQVAKKQITYKQNLHKLDNKA